MVDGRAGFTGSQKLIDASYNKKGNLKRGLQWHELMMRLEGPVVRELDAVFATDWYSETYALLPLDASAGVPGQGPELIDAQVLPSGPSFDNDNNLKLYATLIHKAERRVSITSPYLVPDESILLAIVTAAARGLSVELFVSEVGDRAWSTTRSVPTARPCFAPASGSTCTGSRRCCTQSTSPLMKRLQ